VSFVIESPQAFQKEIQDQVNVSFADILRTLPQDIKGKTQSIVEAAIKAQPEYFSLLDGELRSIFGLEEPTALLEALIKAVVDGINVQYDGEAGFEIKIFSPDFGEVINGGFASFRSEHDFNVPWLNWLLFYGDSVILADYSVDFDPHNPALSRTGSAIMVKLKGTAQPFRVPPEFSGVADNNWLTRSVDNIDDVLEDYIVSLIEERLS
jgi:hypothetical protein